MGFLQRVRWLPDSIQETGANTIWETGPLPASRSARSVFLRIGELLLVLGLPASFYLRTLAPGLTWAHRGQDGGDLAAAVATGGIPHPTGYPTYLLLGRLFFRLPLGTVAWRLNLMSAVCALASVVVVYALGRRLLGKMGMGAWLALAAALTGAWAWGVSPLLWSQAVITEVYTLHALLVALFLYLAVRWERDDDHYHSSWHWLVLGLVAGLGLGNHLTFALVILGVGVGHVLSFVDRLSQAPPSRISTQHRRAGGFVGAGLLLGLSVYLYLPWAAGQDGAYVWGEANTWSGFWWLVSGGPYRQFVFGLPWWGVPGRLSAVAESMLGQFGLAGIALALIGLAGLWRRKRSWVWAGAAIVLLVTVYAVGYDTSDAEVYLLPVVLLMAVGLVLGWGQVLMELRQRWPRLTVCATGMGLLIVLGVGWLRLPAMDLSGDTAAADWGRSVMAALPSESIAVSRQDGHTFTLTCMQLVEGLRPDVIVVDADLLGYDWYRQGLEVRYSRLTADDTIEGLLQRNPGRVVVEVSGL